MLHTASFTSISARPEKHRKGKGKNKLSQNKYIIKRKLDAEHMGTNYVPELETTLKRCLNAERVSKFSCRGGTDCNRNPSTENPDTIYICC